MTHTLETFSGRDTFPFPDLLEKFFPPGEDQDPDYDEDDIPEDDDD